MRNLKKLIAITAMTALLLIALTTCAFADEKIYTSPVFTLPLERLLKAEEIINAQEQAAALAAQAETEEPGEEGEVPEESQAPAEGEQTEEGSSPEGTEEPDEYDEDESFEELGDDAGEVTDEPAEEKRKVVIKSSQGAIVTEGDQITLTSELYGFGDLPVEYQWQVDRGDGEGWVDVNGANKFKYTFIANEETIKYSWRLIVNVVEE